MYCNDVPIIALNFFSPSCLRCEFLQRWCTKNAKGGERGRRKKKWSSRKKFFSHTLFSFVDEVDLSLSHTTAAVRIDDDERRRSVSRFRPGKDGEPGGDQEGV